MKLRNLKVEVLGRGLFGVCAQIEEGSPEELEALRDKPVRAEFSEWKEKRSLSANAYFHVLAHKIAQKARISDEDAKSALVQDYGALKRNDDGTPLGLMIPEGQKPEKLGVKYAKWFDVRLLDGKLYDCYMVYEETHLLDTAQMSRLIEGTIAEAKELGIETLTPEELKRMGCYVDDT